MHNHYLPANYSDHDRASAELFASKSLDALIFLIDHGRELEFAYAGQNYFLSCDGSKQYVSIWCKDTQQSFASMEDLIQNATLQGVPFLSAWNHAELQYLF